MVWVAVGLGVNPELFTFFLIRVYLWFEVCFSEQVKNQKNGAKKVAWVRIRIAPSEQQLIVDTRIIIL